ncbi:hypothetical protein [Lentzea sp. NPDC003310]|uniref:hypothetical protein n=1 Tax=Lentzea sp. NPDC003310 TaxID=3154447 RepID=UPI00339DAF85
MSRLSEGGPTVNHSSFDSALRDVLASIRATSGADLAVRSEHARRCLATAVAKAASAPRQALEHVAAADEHLEYGELTDARTRLIAARSHLRGLRLVAARA